MGLRAALRLASLAALLLTPLGSFDCGVGIRCQSAVEGIVGYWRPPHYDGPRTPAGTPTGLLLLVLPPGRVFGAYECELWGDGPEVWWCE